MSAFWPRVSASSPVRGTPPRSGSFCPRVREPGEFILPEGKRLKKYLPSAIGIGIAMVIPLYYSITICAGAILGWLIGLKWESMKDNGFLVGAAGIAGETLVMIAFAILASMGVI